MAGFLAGLGAGAQGILGQRAANQKAAEDAQNLAIEQATARIQQQNALLSQEKIEQATKQWQAQQDALARLRQTHPEWADAIALGLKPSELGPQPTDYKLYPQKFPDGTIHQMGIDQKNPTAPPRDFGIRPDPGADLAAKFASTPVGALTGKTAVDAEGNPIPDIMAPLAKSGAAAILSDKDYDQLQNNKSAQANLQVLADTGKKVLPATEPTTTAEYISDFFAKPAERYLKAQVGPGEYTDFAEARAGIIRYMRALTGAARVNQQELATAIDRLQKAKTYPALQAAVQTAQKLLQQDQAGLIKAGRLNGGGSSASSGGSSSEAQERILPDGRRAWLRKNNGKVEILGPGGWGPYNG